MTAAEFSRAVLGRPYRLGAAGPEAYDCWGLVRHYYAAARGVALPVVDAVRTLAIARAFSGDPERANWAEVESPAEGDAVLMGQARRPHHVGLWLGGGVLHAVEGAGVIHTQPALLRLGGWNVVGYYRHC